MKKAIAMKCTQENWDSIKDRIPKEYEVFRLGKFKKSTYIVLYEDKSITNGSFFDRDETDEIHETFNAKIFLEACVIECDTFTITKETVIKYDMKDEFPEVFGKPFTGWAKDTLIGNEKWLGYFENDILMYGIDANGVYFIDRYKIGKYSECRSNIEATPQEVESALIFEAKKRGYVDGIYYIEPENCFMFDSKKQRKAKGQIQIYNNNLNHLCFSESVSLIFKDGIWATIIQPEKMTLEQIEKELGRKIELI